jgi:hypothetical protein
MAAASAKSPQRNTVTVTVRQGDSPNPTATFSATMAARSVLVGSGAEAQWKLRGSGVEAVHAELYWDGSKLFVRDPGSRSGVYVGVERADEWKQLYDGSEVTFGQAVLQTRVVGPDARPPVDPAVDAATNFYNAPPPSSMADDEEGTAVLGKKNLVAAAGAFSPPRSTSAPGPRPPVSVPQVPPRVATLAPSRNPSSPLPAVPPLSRPAEAPAPPLVAAPVAQETVIRMSPYAPQEPARPAPAAGSKAPTAPLSEERTVMHEGLAAVAANIPPPTVRTPTLGPAVGIAGASSPLMNPLAPAPSFSANGTSPSLQASRPRNSTPAPGGGVDDPFADAFPPPSGKGLVTDDGTGPKLLGMPTRTWILVGGTLVVALLANLLGPPAPTRGAAAVPQIQVESVGSTPPASNNILGLPTGASGMVGVILVRPLPTTDASGRPAALPPSNPQDPLRLAAEAVNAHRYDQAAGMYEALAREHREAPLFQQFAVVLRARVANPTCTPGAPGCPLPASPTPPANPATPQAPGAPAPAP